MSQFDFNELMKKDDKDLAKIKLAQEVYSFEDKYAWERKKFKTETIRIFMIAIMTSVITLGSTYIIELFKQSYDDRKRLAGSITNLQDEYARSDEAKRKDIACRIAEIDVPVKETDLRKSVQKYLQICNNLSGIQEDAAQISATDTSSAQTQSAIAKLDVFDEKIKTLQLAQKSVQSSFEKSNYQIAINRVNDSIDQVIRYSPELKTAVKSTSAIEKSIKEVDSLSNKLVKNDVDVIRKSKISWFKEGYFLQFGEYRVLLQYLDKNLGIKVQVCKTTGSGSCTNPIVNKAWVYLKSPLDFTDTATNENYRIKLVTVDHAGKNPFKLAAYISFEQVKK